jgi:hypothetical protein
MKMKFIKFFAILLTFLLLNSYILSRSHTRRRRRSTMSNRFTLIDPNTCTPNDQPEEGDQGFDVGKFILNIFEKWDIPGVSTIVAILNGIKENSDTKCPSKPQLMDTYNKIYNCKEEQERVKVVEQQDKLNKLKAKYFSDSEIQDISNLSPREACEKSFELLRNQSSKLKYGNVESYDKACDFFEKHFLEADKLEFNLEECLKINSHCKTYYNIIQESALKFGTLEELKNPSIYQNIRDKIYENMVKIYHSHVHQLAEIESNLPICKTLSKKSKKLEPTKKYSIIRKGRAFIQAFMIWSQNGCSIFRSIFNYFKDNQVDDILEKLEDIVVNVIGDIILKVFKFIMWTFQFLNYAYKAIKNVKAVPKQMNEFSENFGSAIGTLLKIIFKMLIPGFRRKI